MEKVAPNPVRTRLEELTQAFSQELRKVADFADRPASAVRQAARIWLDGLATTLETSDPKHFIRSASRFIERGSDTCMSALGFHQTVDMLMDTVAPCSDSADDLRMMWQAARQAHMLTAPLGVADELRSGAGKHDAPAMVLAHTEPLPAAIDQMAEIVRRERVFELLMDHLPQKAFWKDANGVFLGCNLAFAQDAGYTSPQEMVGKTDDDTPWKEFAEKYRADDRLVMHNMVPLLDIIEEHVNDQGERTWIKTSKIPLKDESGAVFGILGLFEDVTERIEKERVQTENQALLQLVMSNIPQAIFWKDRNGVFLGCNQAVADDAGLASAADIIGKTDDDMPWKDQAEAYRADDLAVMNSGAPRLNYEEPQTGPTGETTWLSTSKIPMRDKDGRVFAVLGMYEDITERMRRERALAENQALLQLVMSNIPQAIFWKDRNGVYLGGNQAIADDAGLASPAEIIGKTDDDMPWTDQAEAYRADDLAVMESGVPRLNYEEPQTGPTGETTWLSTSKIPMRDKDGKVFAVLGMYEDITARKRLEAEREESLQRRGFQVQVGTRLAQEISAASDLGYLFEHAVTLIKDQFGYYHTQILRYDPALDAVVLIAGYGETGKAMLAAGHQMPLGSGLIGRAAASGQTLLRPDLSADPDWKPNPLLPETRGEIAVPIKFREQVLGVLDVQSNRSGALTEDDRLLLEGMCGQIAVAIEDTRLRQQMDERLKELDALYRSTSHEGWQAFNSRERAANGYVYDRITVQPVVETPAPAEAGEPPDARVTPLTVRGEVIGALGVYDDPDRPLSDEDRQLIDDVTEQVAQALERARLFEQTQQALSESQTLFSGSAQILRAGTFQEILEALVTNGPLAFLDRASMLFFDSTWDLGQQLENRPETMTIMAMHSKLALPAGQGVGERLPVSTFARWENIEDVLKPVIISDIHIDDRVHPDMVARLSSLGIRGTVVFQLHLGNEFYGYLTGQTTQLVQIGEDEVRLIMTLLEQATIVIRSLMLQKEMSERVQELTSLQRLMSREAWSAYQDQAAQETMGFLYDLVELKPVTPESVPALAGANGNGWASSGEGEENAMRLPSEAPGYATPLNIRGETFGTLGVRLSPGRSLSSDEEEFLNAISEQVAQAMERARLMEQTQKSAVELQAVAEVGTATATILEPEALLQQVADLTQQRFGLYHTNIYLLSESEQDLILTAGSGKVGRHLTAEGWSIPLEEPESVVAAAARNRQTYVLNDVNLEAGHLKNPLLPDTRSELTVPLIIADRLLGVFDVQSRYVNRFTQEDIRIYNTLAAQVTVALQNAKLYAEQLATLERMRELDNMKSAFLANMSHELRTPLNSILGFTQVITEGLDGPVTEIMTADLELIEKNGKHLLHLINEILDMSKIESGRLSLSPEPIDVNLLMEDVIETSSPLARNRNLYMDLISDHNEDWVVMADQVRLRQIFINLISNALKFTEQGGLTIQLQKAVTGTSDGVQNEIVRIHLKDTGIGIPENKLEEIFEAFTQVDSSTTRKVGGTGLGLPISRRLVEMHGGRLWAESPGLGFGSTFVLELPVGVRE